MYTKLYIVYSKRWIHVTSFTEKHTVYRVCWRCGYAVYFPCTMAHPPSLHLCFPTTTTTTQWLYWECAWDITLQNINSKHTLAQLNGPFLYPTNHTHTLLYWCVCRWKRVKRVGGWLRYPPGKQHLNTGMSADQRRRLRSPVLAHPSHTHALHRLMPYP